MPRNQNASWREWSRRRIVKAARRQTYTKKPVVASMDECIATVEQISGICHRASLPNAAKWLTLCVVFLREHTDRALSAEAAKEGRT